MDKKVKKKRKYFTYPTIVKPVDLILSTERKEWSTGDKRTRFYTSERLTPNMADGWSIVWRAAVSSATYYGSWPV